MQIPNEKLKELLVKEGLISPQDFAEIEEEATRMGQSISDILISRNIITKDFFNGILVDYFDVEKAGLISKEVDPELVRILPEEIARDKRVIVFGKEKDGSYSVAMEDPSDIEISEFLTRYLNSPIKIYFASREDFNYGLSFYSRGGSEDFKKLIEDNAKASLQSRLSGSSEEVAQELPIVSIVDNLLAYAASSRASDIHIEPLENEILVRYRIDGLLREITRLPKEVHPGVTARLKLLAALKLDDHTHPQDGRFRIKLGPDPIDFRVSVIPTVHGEKVEMRLLTGTQRPLSFEELGMSEETIKILKDNIKKSFGMILVSGPTGSGKSTTLYSILNVLNKPEVNIVTVEDPVEYNIKYVNQTQINPQAGITFAGALRSILRQDPNIILVGEIRDKETADISVNAALTGHLLLSTVHTNDAPTAIPRLLDMKVPAFLAAAVLNVVLAQRLVGKICEECIESYKPDERVLGLIKKQIQELGLERDYKPPKILYRGKGCKKCNNSGLKGRIGIFETLSFDDETRNYITNPDFSLDELRKMARRKGMITMFEDGLQKAERGMTVIDEVLRVIRE
ncbi:type II/IV secretion system protein [Candidatus Wolfebacteria bacterium]|nr:type II/IV secretion system protein [Candidatus Wolfebacteria bacterium]